MICFVFFLICMHTYVRTGAHQAEDSYAGRGGRTRGRGVEAAERLHQGDDGSGNLCRRRRRSCPGLGLSCLALPCLTLELTAVYVIDLVLGQALYLVCPCLALRWLTLEITVLVIDVVLGQALSCLPLPCLVLSYLVLEMIVYGD